MSTSPDHKVQRTKRERPKEHGLGHPAPGVVDFELAQDYRRLFGDMLPLQVYEDVQLLQAEKDDRRRLKARSSALSAKLQAKEEIIAALQQDNKLLLDEVNGLRGEDTSVIHLDVALNEAFEMAAEERQELQRKLRAAEEEKQATGFTSESYDGKRLVAKCNLLARENRELGKEKDEGTQLTIELSLWKNHVGAIQRDHEEAREQVVQLMRELCRAQDANQRLLDRIKARPGPGHSPANGMNE